MVLSWLLACAHTFPGPVGSLVDRPAAPVDTPARRPGAHPPSARPPADPGRAVAAAAAGFVGDRSLVVRGETYRYDCSGLVEASLAAAGIPAEGSSAMLFEAARDAGVLHRRRLPSPGDIAFFDDTYDRDGNGRLDDALSHSAVVEAVDPDGTITLVHVGSRGVVRFHMNLRHPEEGEGPQGQPWNDPLRAKKAGDPRRTRYLAGELWAGFGSFWRLDPPVASTR